MCKTHTWHESKCPMKSGTPTNTEPGSHSVRVHSSLASPARSYMVWCISSLPHPLCLSFSLSLSQSWESKLSLATSFPEKQTSLRKEFTGKKKMSQTRDQPYHVVHKLPPGDSPYVRAKHVQVHTYIYVHDTWMHSHVCMYLYQYIMIILSAHDPTLRCTLTNL